MHVSERKLTTNTANWLNLTLSNSIICIRGQKKERLDVSKCLDDHYTPLYLFPDDDAVPLDDSFKEKHKGPFNLIVPDGHWKQASKVKLREKRLHNIMTVKIVGTQSSNYQLRKAPYPGALCTYEAVMYALRELESEELFLKMNSMFETMVGQILQARSGALLGDKFLK